MFNKPRLLSTSLLSFQPLVLHNYTAGYQFSTQRKILRLNCKESYDIKEAAPKINDAVFIFLKAEVTFSKKDSLLTSFETLKQTKLLTF